MFICPFISFGSNVSLNLVKYSISSPIVLPSQETPSIASSPVNNGLTSTLILIIPLSMLMYVFATPLMSLFRAGQFNVDDVRSIANILQFWLISLPFYSCVMYLYNTFAAIRKFYIFAII